VSLKKVGNLKKLLFDKMPQFDKITFFNQIFWLILIFSGFYFILLKNFLPKIGSVLKARNKKLLKSNTLAEQFKSEESSVLADSNRVFVGTASLCRTNLFNGVGKSNDWLSSSQKNLLISDLKNTQKEYFKSFGKISAKKFLI
jgi:F-type H+-transporting ATPase subunit b